ncbi:MAG: hypothetical protein M1135_02575 [Candidatus Omnitrophica bacterium]|nr:hypothetical protein [Candidatus Omnitrophota bacterium]
MIGIIRVKEWANRIPLHSFSPDFIYEKCKEMGLPVKYVSDDNDFKDINILLNLYPNIYPSFINNDLNRFREAQGSLITTLPAFTTLLKYENQKWNQEKQTKQTHESLGLPELFPVCQADAIVPEKKNPFFSTAGIKINSYRYFWSYVINTLSLPEEDEFYGVLRCEKEGNLKGYVCGWIRHNCMRYKGIVDFVGFSMERLIISRPAIEKILFSGIISLLKEKQQINTKFYIKINNNIKKFKSPFEKQIKIKKGTEPKNIFHKNSTTNSLLLIKDLPETLEDKLLFHSLQGLVNRSSREKIYFGNDFLLELISNKGIEIKETDKESIIKKYADNLEGCVEYDPDDPVSINLSISLAGIKNYLPVTKDIIERYHLDLPIKDTFVKRFKNYKEGYQWAKIHLLPYCSKKLVYHMKHIREKDTEFTGKMVDYLISHKIFSFHLDTDPKDEDIKEAINILASLDELAAVSGMFYYNGLYHEAELTSLVSEAGKLMIACYNNNLTVHSSFEIENQMKQRRRMPISLEKDKIYVSFVFTDGDNMGYMIGGVNQGSKFHEERWWGNKGRGKVPLGWTIGPAIYEIAPLLLKYYYDTQYDNDNFIDHFSSGYTYGDIFGRLYKKQEYEVKKSLCNLTDRYLKKLDIKTINTHHIGTSDITYNLFANHTPSLKGILADYNGHPCPYHLANYIVGNKKNIPVFHSFEPCEKPPENPAEYIVARINKLSGLEKPLFVHFSLVNWWFTPEDVFQASLKLGKDVVLVTPEEIVNLYTNFIL